MNQKFKVTNRPDLYQWVPKKDITTYELAQCFPIVTEMQRTTSQVHFWEEKVEALPESCQRHFEVIEWE